MENVNGKYSTVQYSTLLQQQQQLLLQLIFYAPYIEAHVVIIVAKIAIVKETWSVMV